LFVGLIWEAMAGVFAAIITVIGRRLPSPV
jgi:hypothetical protein